MASTGDLTVANGVMKIVGGKLTKQYEEIPLLHNRMQKGRGTKISDRGVEIPTHLSPNPAHRWMSDGGDFPAGGSNTVKRAQVFFKNYGFATRMTGGAIDAVNSMDVAYIKDWLQFNLDETMSTGYKFGNIYAWGTGNGALATINSGANSAVQSVASGGNRFLRDGLVIDSVTTSSGVVTVSAATVLVAKASATSFTTVAAMTTTVTSDVIVASGSYNLAVTGIQAMVDDTTNGPVTFQGLSRNTYPQYRAFRVTAASNGLDISYLRRMLGAGIHIATGELNRDALELWSHPAQWSAYNALGWQLKRFEGKSLSVELGFTAAEYEGINWIQDVDAPTNQIYALDWTTFGKYIAKDFGWDDKTGAILRQVPSATSGIAYTDTYEAYWTGRFNYGCTRPNKNALIDLLAVPTGF
jgi:hypothetical protein